MFATGESLEDVEEWAKETFPVEFGLVTEYLQRHGLVLFDHEARFKLNPAKSSFRVYKSMAVLVGLTFQQEHPVYACTDRTGNLLLYHQYDSPSQATEGSSAPVEFKFAQRSGTGIRFTPPFNWLRPDVEEVGAARLEALIQYMHLSSKTLRPIAEVKIAIFREHFEGACRKIAKRLKHAVPNGGEIQRSMSLTVPSAASTGFQPLEELTVPVKVSRKRPRTTEEICTAIRGDLDEVMTATQAAYRQEKEKLHAKIQTLEKKAADAEKERDNHKAEVIAAGKRVKLAEEESQRAKKEALEFKTRYKDIQKLVQKYSEHYEALGKLFLCDDEISV